MMTDIFVEYMVKKKVGPKDILICLGASVLAALILFLLTVVVTQVGAQMRQLKKPVAPRESGGAESPATTR